MKGAILIVIGLLSLLTGLAAQSSEKIWNFDGDKTGNIPTGFSNEGGDWKIVADPTAPSRPNALAQLAKNSGSTFNVTLVNGATFKDVDISVMMRAIAGQEDQGEDWFGGPRMPLTTMWPVIIRWRIIIGSTKSRREDGFSFRARTSNTARAGIP